MLCLYCIVRCAQVCACCTERCAQVVCVLYWEMRSGYVCTVLRDALRWCVFCNERYSQDVFLPKSPLVCYILPSSTELVCNGNYTNNFAKNHRKQTKSNTNNLKFNVRKSCSTKNVLNFINLKLLKNTVLDWHHWRRVKICVTFAFSTYVVILFSLRDFCYSWESCIRSS